jgi:hypothetical protein
MQIGHNSFLRNIKLCLLNYIKQKVEYQRSFIYWEEPIPAIPMTNDKTVSQKPQMHSFHMYVAPRLVTLSHLNDIEAEMLLQMVRKQQRTACKYGKDSPEFNYFLVLQHLGG